MDNLKSTLSFAQVTFSFLSQFLVQSERQCSPYFLPFQVLERRIYSDPISTSWMGKGTKYYKKPHRTNNKILKYNIWIWKENIKEEKTILQGRHFNLLRKSKTGIKSGHYRQILCCVLTSACKFCAIYLNTSVSIAQKLVLFQLSHWHTQTFSVSVYATAPIYNFVPFEINCTLNLKAILSSLVCSTDPIFDI